MLSLIAVAHAAITSVPTGIVMRPGVRKIKEMLYRRLQPLAQGSRPLSWLVTFLFGSKTYPPVTRRDLPLLFFAGAGALLLLGVAGAALDQTSPLFWHAFASDPRGALTPPGLASIGWMVGLKTIRALLRGLIADAAFLLKWSLPGLGI